MGIPAYQYPGGDLWRELELLPPGSLVVLDPADGPGEAPDPTYVSAILPVRRRGVGLFGYVTTGYGRRTAAEMIGEVTRYEQWYQPGGVFLDQTPPACTANAEIEATLEHARSRGLALAINPGQPDIDPEDVRASDHVVNFEGPLTTYRRTRFPSWTAEFDSDKFWHLVYEVDAQSLGATLALTARRRAGTVFVTDSTMPNPWDTVPTYWSEELRLVANGGSGPRGWRSRGPVSGS